MSETIGPIFFTTYALTEGVIMIPAAELLEDGRLIRFRLPDSIMNCCEPKPHWHLSEQEALAQVDAMAVRKLASLKKEATKVEKILEGVRRGSLPKSSK